MKIDNIYFVYCFVDTRKSGQYIFNDNDTNYKFDYEPIYIGKGKGIRPKRHFSLYKNSNIRFYNKLKSIIDDGYQPEIIYLKNDLIENEAFEYEKYFIKLIGRKENNGTLTNLTDGGEGQSGFKHSEKTKTKMSSDRMGEKNAHFGKHLSDESKLNISLSKKNTVSSFKGKHHTNESKMMMSIRAKERTGEKNSMYNKKHSEKSKLLMSKNRIKLYGKNNPNYRREYSEEEKTFDTWEITNINGNFKIINNLAKFCRENRLNASCMRDIYYGRMKKYKGWIKVNKLTNNVKKKKV